MGCCTQPVAGEKVEVVKMEQLLDNSYHKYYYYTSKVEPHNDAQLVGGGGDGGGNGVVHDVSKVSKTVEEKVVVEKAVEERE
eukprot:5385552-Prymnesium_polylepis.1